ncbi:Transcriptional activator of acetoin/glycerol metabolism [Myxococcus hansupus]|uniref:Transcriptional activator of acetoin/glycerol metabolism n=1 Tax=Pseudomyxococcus hansupus TaxID=1297742 RepID=A0A0H4XAL3_9BACT|nr:sigma 54-interacting transcriptional regulator [Myxococcus hansupus]AKQ64932.1 Transcriptional activator of acetoin/glycerol metabolism [Myxococcus hansupus]
MGTLTLSASPLLWEQFLVGALDGEAGLRPELRSILPRWQRSRTLGAPSTGQPDEGPSVGSLALVERRARLEPVWHELGGMMEMLSAAPLSAGRVAVLADREGVILATRSSGGDFTSHADYVRLVEGACWDETSRGTNAIGTALAEASAVAVVGPAHYAQRHHGLVCYAAPVHDPFGELVAVLDVTGPAGAADPLVLVAVASVAQAAESRLREVAWARVAAAARGGLESRLAREDGPVFIVESPGQVSRFNATARVLLGGRSAVSVEAALGVSWRALADAALRGAALETRVLSAGPTWRVHAEAVGTGGAALAVLVRLEPLGARVSQGTAGAAISVGALVERGEDTLGAAASQRPPYDALGAGAPSPLLHDALGVGGPSPSLTESLGAAASQRPPRQGEGPWAPLQQGREAPHRKTPSLIGPWASLVPGRDVAHGSSSSGPGRAPTQGHDARSRSTPLSEAPWRALTGNDAQHRATLREAERFSPTSLPVLLLSETGTGKELLARAIHAASTVATGPFVAVNCGALSPALLESELFGHAPGAFTGARMGGADGKLAAADGGTLFLDELAEMPPALQVLLLRVLEDGSYSRVGESRVRRSRFRLVGATCRDLDAAVRSGAFRSDLYFRLQGAVLRLPPLRERTDLPELAQALLARLAEEEGLPPPVLTATALARLATHRWPGNVRELKTVLRLSLIRAGGAPLLDADALPPNLGTVSMTSPHVAASRAPGALFPLEGTPSIPRGESGPTARPLRELEAHAIQEALALSGGNVAQAARRLGIARSTLYRMAERFGLVLPSRG